MDSVAPSLKKSHERVIVSRVGERLLCDLSIPLYLYSTLLRPCRLFLDICSVVTPNTLVVVVSLVRS